MKTCLYRARMAALPLALAAAFPAAAQGDLKETRVTATRFAEPAESLPMGVSVITDEEIRASGATSVNDAIVRLLGIPGRQDLFNGGDVSVDLRGFGATSDNNQVVVLDGIRLSENDLSAPRLAGIPIESIERIEVLRGSGAVLYGEGASGGVIVITTKAGSGRQQATGATVYAAAGTHALRDVRASGTLHTEQGLTLDANAQKRETKGHRANSASESEAGSVGGQWGNGWLRLGARVARDDLDARLPGSLTAAQYAANPRQTNTADDFASIRNERVTAFAQAELSAWQLAFDAGKRWKKLRSMSFGFPVDYDVEADTYALRARNEAALGGAKNVLVLGFDHNDWARTDYTFGPDAHQDADAFYAKNDVVFATGTRLSLGARTERIRKDAGDTVLDDRQNAWELGVSQPFATGWTGYARIGRSFRLANVDEFTFTSPGVMLKPQVSRDAELGARWTYAKGKVDARLYRSALTEEIGFDPNAPGPFGSGANVNFDPTRRQGLELDWNHQLTSSLGVRLNAAVRKASFRSGSYAGKDVPLVPSETLALRADWTPAAGHRINAGLNWISSQHPDFDNACRIPAYATADLRYAYQWRNAELSLGVGNLFDKKYYTQAFGCSAGVTTSIYPEAGRTVTAALRVRF